MIDADFVAAVLDGIEGTIEELMARVDFGDLRTRLSELQTATAATRRSFEEAGRLGHEA